MNPPSLSVTRFIERLAHHKFRSTWSVEGSAADVFHVLNNIGDYPRWWPEIRAVRLLDEAHAEVDIRAALPYWLRIQLEKEIADEAGGILRTRISGDLDGWSSWSITAVGGACLLRFDEEVVTTKRVMNALAPIARPLFRLNHTLMMRHGEQGLRRFLT